MKKFIYIPDFLAIVAGLLRGESFEGRLFIDKDTHVLTLKLWKRKAPKNTNYSKVRYPLSMGMGSMLSAMEADKNQAKQAIVDEYIMDNA